MFAAHDALSAAAEHFDAIGDPERAQYLRGLAECVAAEDPDLHDRVWRVLPREGEPGVRPDPLPRRLSIASGLMWATLRSLSRRRQAKERGGWWRGLGDCCPSSVVLDQYGRPVDEVRDVA